MIEQIGTWNNKKGTNVTITADEIIAGIGNVTEKEKLFHDYVQRDKVILTYPDRKVVPNALNNDLDCPIRCQLRTLFFMATDKHGNSCQFRYYNTAQPIGNNAINYQPTSLNIISSGIVETITNKDKEYLVWVLLNPLCENSPLHDPYENSASWKVKDVGMETRNASIANRELVALQAKIYEQADADLPKLAIKAQGMRINREIPSINDYTDVADVTNGLIEFANKFPSEFKQAFESTETGTRGLIVECIRLNLFEFKAVSQQMTVMLNGRTLCSFPKSTEVTEGIYQYILENDFATHEKALNKAINDSKKANK